MINMSAFTFVKYTKRWNCRLLLLFRRRWLLQKSSHIPKKRWQRKPVKMTYCCCLRLIYLLSFWFSLLFFFQLFHMTFDGCILFHFTLSFSLHFLFATVLLSVSIRTLSLSLSLLSMVRFSLAASVSMIGAPKVSNRPKTSCRAKRFKSAKQM